MKYELVSTTAFRKSYKRMKKRGADMGILSEVIHELEQGHPLAEKYRDHLLKGPYAGFRECHIAPDWLLIYAQDEELLLITLTNTGTHADLFNM